MQFLNTSSIIPKTARFLAFSLFVAFLAGSLSFSHAQPAGQSALPVQSHDIEPLQPSADQKRTTKEIVQNLSARHYRNQPVDDDLSGRYLDAYLEILDPTKSFFYASDIKDFSKDRVKFDDYFKNGDLAAGFDIYNRYRERVIIRLEAIIARLESEDFSVDFDKDEEMLVETEDAEWSQDQESANRMWYKLNKSRLLAIILAEEVDVNSAANDRTIEPQIQIEQDGDEEDSFDTKFAEAKTKLIKRYQNTLNRITQQNATDVHEAMMNALAQLYDPHTSYLAPRTLENFNINMSLSLEGIGAELTQDDEYTIVNRIVRGGPAYKQGSLKRNDKIVAVGQGDEGELVDVVGKRLDEVVSLIRGPRDTVVRLRVTNDKDSGSNIIRIVRNQVKLEDQAARKGVQTFTDGHGSLYKVGIIEVPGFYIDFDAYRRQDPNYKSTTRDVSRLLDELEQENVDGIIIDLRNNGGGSLQEAEMLTDLFIDPGAVVQIRQSNENIHRLSSRSRNIAKYRGPLIVLINRLSASASEIFAGAIQDYNRGLIVGGQSFGKGTVQSLTPVHEGQIKITESKFYRVSGESTQHRGVIPDVVYPDFIDTTEVGESAYDNALPWDKIDPVPHGKYYNLSGVIPALQNMHDKRVVKDPDFTYLIDMYTYSKARNNQKYVSLNINTRREEMQERQQEQLSIENKRRAAKGLPPYKTTEEYFEKEEAMAEQREEEEYKTNSIKIDPGADPILNETALVMVDFINVMNSNSAQKVANF